MNEYPDQWYDPYIKLDGYENLRKVICSAFPDAHEKTVSNIMIYVVNVMRMGTCVITLHNNYFSENPPKYHTHTYAKKALKMLKDDGYLKVDIGKRLSSADKGKSTTIHKTKKLASLVSLSDFHGKDESDDKNYPDLILTQNENLPTKKARKKTRKRIEILSKQKRKFTERIEYSEVLPIDKAKSHFLYYFEQLPELLSKCRLQRKGYQDIRTTIRRGHTKWFPEPGLSFLEVAQNNINVLNRYYSDVKCSVDIARAERDMGTLSEDDRNKLYVREHVHLARYFNIENYPGHGRFFTNGGRSHQNLSKKKKQREYLLLDGEQTTEYDFASIHPSLLYARVEKPIPKDIYERIVADLLGKEKTNDMEMRGVVKRIVLICFNASRKGAIQRVVLKEDQHEKENPEKLILPILEKHNIKVMQVVDAFMETHKDISEYICSGVGNRLMLCESQICENILFRCFEKGFPALSIHDSFIAPKKNEKDLKRIMEEESMKFTGIESILAKKEF